MNIEFIIPHCKGRTYNMVSAMSSIAAQTNPSWKIHVVCDGVVDDIEYIRSVFSKLENIKYTTVDKHYGDWGHTPRNIGIRSATEDWVVFGGNDNYYAPCFVEKVIESVSMNPNLKFIYCDMIHSHYNYDFFKCKPLINQIDMGSFVSLTKFAKKILLNPVLYYADGQFVEDYIKKFCKEDEICYLPHVYYIHN
jgi:glycosyltransferase involved in cell wall biosynthesis